MAFLRIASIRRNRFMVLRGGLGGTSGARAAGTW
jgi:hypothetical protein